MNPDSSDVIDAPLAGGETRLPLLEVAVPLLAAGAYIAGYLVVARFYRRFGIAPTEAGYASQDLIAQGGLIFLAIGLPWYLVAARCRPYIELCAYGQARGSRGYALAAWAPLLSLYIAFFVMSFTFRYGGWLQLLGFLLLGFSLGVFTCSWFGRREVATKDGSERKVRTASETLDRLLAQYREQPSKDRLWRLVTHQNWYEWQLASLSSEAPTLGMAQAYTRSVNELVTCTSDSDGWTSGHRIRRLTKLCERISKESSDRSEAALRARRAQNMNELARQIRAQTSRIFAHRSKEAIDRYAAQRHAAAAELRRGLVKSGDLQTRVRRQFHRQLIFDIIIVVSALLFIGVFATGAIDERAAGFSSGVKSGWALLPVGPKVRPARTVDVAPSVSYLRNGQCVLYLGQHDGVVWLFDGQLAVNLSTELLGLAFVPNCEYDADANKLPTLTSG
jgi:hypothetical protein